jgi:hypothetical protein
VDFEYAVASQRIWYLTVVFVADDMSALRRRSLETGGPAVLTPPSPVVSRLAEVCFRDGTIRTSDSVQFGLFREGCKGWVAPDTIAGYPVRIEAAKALCQELHLIH